MRIIKKLISPKGIIVEFPDSKYYVMLTNNANFNGMNNIPDHCGYKYNWNIRKELLERFINAECIVVAKKCVQI